MDICNPFQRQIGPSAAVTATTLTLTFPRDSYEPFFMNSYRIGVYEVPIIPNSPRKERIRPLDCPESHFSGFWSKKTTTNFNPFQPFLRIWEPVYRDIFGKSDLSWTCTITCFVGIPLLDNIREYSHYMMSRFR